MKRLPWLAIAAALTSCGGTTEHLTNVPCGAGTHESSGQCVANAPILCGMGTHLDTGVCVLDNAALTCGSGTHASNGMCVPDNGLTCGTGTHVENGMCFPDVSMLTCGSGTHAVNLMCIADSMLACGPGTHADGTNCVPDATPLQCGAGTIQNAGQCVVLNGTASYDVRVPVLTVPADGITPIPVLAIGRNADGSPSTATVTFGLTRPGAGTFDRINVVLSPIGSTVYFTPCNPATTPSCIGPVQITLSLASTQNVVATSPTINLVMQAGVGSPAPCLAGGNVVFFNGDTGDYIHPGMATINRAVWNVSASPASGTTQVSVDLTPSDPSQGSDWSIDFATDMIGPMHEQVYANAERWPFESPNHPGLSIAGDGRGCNMLTGQFQIEDLTVSNMNLVSFTATFEQHCEGGSAALRGCVHVHM
jgi:hypothetical protein